MALFWLRQLSWWSCDWGEGCPRENYSETAPRDRVDEKSAAERPDPTVPEGGMYFLLLLLEPIQCLQP